MSMELPVELYIYILGLSDDVRVTKSFRLLTKTALSATHYYHKIILSMPIHCGYNGNYWTFLLGGGMTTRETQQYFKELFWKQQCLGKTLLATNDWDEFTAFKMTVKDLMSSS